MPSFDVCLYSFAYIEMYLASVDVKAVVASLTRDENNKRSYGSIKCHRYGSPTNHGNAQRLREKWCPFLWTINSKKIKLGGGGHRRVFHIKARNNDHNHRTNATIFQSLAHQRRLTEEQFQMVKRLIEDGVPPADIVTCLRENYPEQEFTNQTVYNARQKIRNVGD